jgi:type III pantothenate kinase
MLLAIDIGNTNIKLGLWDGQNWLRQKRVRTVHEKTADEYGIVLESMCGTLRGINQVVMASVVPTLTITFTKLSERYLGKTPLRVGPQVDMGIRVCTDNPYETGADRMANAAAAYHLYPGPSLIIDMGTATKFEVITTEGDFMGGVIAPGLGLTADALADRAAQLRSVPLEAPPHAMGRNTIHAVQSGLIYGYVGLIEGIIQRLLSEHPNAGQPIPVIGTGGLISVMAPHTAVFHHIEPWLTLTGLRLIGERTKL